MTGSSGGSKTRGRNKSQQTAADLLKRGFPHGKRQSKPMPNSGGQTMVNRPGSSKYQRLIDKMIAKGQR